MNIEIWVRLKLRDMNLDISRYLTLFCKFRTTIDLLSTCHQLWDNRISLLKQNHIILYQRPIVSIWASVEKNYYVGGKEFTVFVDETTGYMDISNVYEYGNMVKHLLNDDSRQCDYSPIFKILHRYLVIYRYRPNIQENNAWYNRPWNYEFFVDYHSIRRDMKAKMDTDNFFSMVFSIIDLFTMDVVFINYSSSPKLETEYAYINRNDKGMPVIHNC